MPLPIPVIIAVVAFLGGAAATSAIILNWDKILIWWSGQRLAVLGPNEVGKTTLIKFLTEGWLPKDYDPTKREPTKGARFQMRDLDLRLGRSMDVGGHEYSRDQWRALVLDSDVLLYLLRADLLLEGDARMVARVADDMELLREWVKEAPKLKQCFVIGTFADKIPGFSSLKGSDLADLENRFQGNPSIVNAVRSLRLPRTAEVPVLVGSLATLEAAQVLVLELFRQVER